MDPYLLNIIEAAEAGMPTPGINLVTNGGDWVRGQPCSSNQFREITWSHYLRDVDQVLSKRPRRERKESTAQVADVAAVPFAAVTEKQGSPAEPVLSLATAILSFGGRADGMNLAAVRIPINAISSWWVSGGSYIKPGSSSGLFGGVLFPIGN
jgi:hypothetical protein